MRAMSAACAQWVASAVIVSASSEIVLADRVFSEAVTVGAGDPQVVTRHVERAVVE